MSSREFDPLRLDVTAFAKEAAELSGRWPLRQLPRVAESAASDAPVSGDVPATSNAPASDDAAVSAEAPASGDAPATGDAAVTWSARGEARATRGTEHETWLHLRARAAIELVCQRCLRPVSCELDVNRHFLFVHGEETAARLDEESEDDVLALTRALNLRDLVEDELLLAMPLVPRHEVCPEPLRVAAQAAEDTEDALTPNPFAALAALKRDAGLN